MCELVCGGVLRCVVGAHGSWLKVIGPCPERQSATGLNEGVKAAAKVAKCSLQPTKVPF